MGVWLGWSPATDEIDQFRKEEIMDTCEERIEEHLESRAEDFLGFIDGMSSDDDDIREETLEEFSNYGLCLDFVEPFTFDDQDEGYLRYQLSWGGPSD